MSEDNRLLDFTLEDVRGLVEGLLDSMKADGLGGLEVIEGVMGGCGGNTGGGRRR